MPKNLTNGFKISLLMTTNRDFVWCYTYYITFWNHNGSSFFNLTYRLSFNLWWLSSSEFFRFGPLCTFCPLTPLPDALFITVVKVKSTQRRLILNTFANLHTIVLALPAWSVGGVMVRTRLLATRAGARYPLGALFLVQQYMGDGDSRDRSFSPFTWSDTCLGPCLTPFRHWPRPAESSPTEHMCRHTRPRRNTCHRTCEIIPSTL